MPFSSPQPERQPDLFHKITKDPHVITQEDFWAIHNLMYHVIQDKISHNKIRNIDVVTAELQAKQDFDIEHDVFRTYLREHLHLSFVNSSADRDRAETIERHGSRTIIRTPGTTVSPADPLRGKSFSLPPTPSGRDRSAGIELEKEDQ